MSQINNILAEKIEELWNEQRYPCDKLKSELIKAELWRWDTPDGVRAKIVSVLEELTVSRTQDIGIFDSWSGEDRDKFVRSIEEAWGAATGHSLVHGFETVYGHASTANLMYVILETTCAASAPE